MIVLVPGGYRYGYKLESFIILIDGVEAGDCQIERRTRDDGTDKIFFLHIVLKPEFQRKGFGTAVHDMIETAMRHLPHRLVPACYLSEKCTQFWLKRNPTLMEERDRENRWWTHYKEVENHGPHSS